MPKTLEKQAIEIINIFIQTMQNNSYEKSAKMVVQLMHKSLLNRDKASLDSDTYRYQFKKAQSNAKHYAYPVKVTCIQKLKTTEIGHPSVGTYDKGVEYKLWIAKKSSSQGLPASLVLFFKEGTNEVKLSYVGSL
ncbi:hypothetical protein YH65_08190 [Sulfurovum lithotrophicum]|uniref:DUF3887 domain-containing protein n=1 Tax=Sulfurovum lithotrophicum TaxID=206403 RepID=A0A7U4M1X2_9BACT|nr:hypothetical protein [Sulfurovum lithotrophicum]AKF25368.1 hypothetical protein YH65_08190 [Sulfurovum lithotrophicum]